MRLGDRPTVPSELELLTYSRRLYGIGLDSRVVQMGVRLWTEASTTKGEAASSGSPY